LALVRATLLLCDSAQVAEGKLYILGWGWTFTGPDPAPFALAVKFDVAWSEMDLPHHWELFLIDEDGRPATVRTPDGNDQAIEVRGDFQVARPPDLPLGSSIGFPLALGFGPIPLAPGSRFAWQLTIDGESSEEWRVPFATRPARAEEAT
jgi:hypothetical protein